MEYLEKWNNARQAIAEANSVDELSAIVNMAEAYRYALKQAKEGVEVVNQATEIKLRAERKAGGFLERMPKNVGGWEERKKTLMEERQKGGELYERLEVPYRNRKITELGITKKQSSQWQKLASIPEARYYQGHGDMKFENIKLVNMST